MLAQPADRVNGARPDIENGCLRQTCTFSGEIFMVKAALSGERLEVVGAPGRKSSVVCFVEVTSLSTFWAEPGRTVAEGTILGAGRAWRSCINWEEFWVGNGEKLKMLMCVLAPVRIFSVVCFE